MTWKETLELKHGLQELYVEAVMALARQDRPKRKRKTKPKK